MTSWGEKCSWEPPSLEGTAIFFKSCCPPCSYSQGGVNDILIPNREIFLTPGRGFLNSPFLLCRERRLLKCPQVIACPTVTLWEFWILRPSAICCGQGTGPSVMVNFMYQFDWATGTPGIWLNISGCVCKRLAFELADWIKQMAHPGAGGCHLNCPPPPPWDFQFCPYETFSSFHTASV